MSSEYSSAGEETEIDADESTSATDMVEKERRKAARAARWREAIAVKVESMPEGDRENYGAFGFAQGDKVLEVRKPRWRSDEVGLVVLLSCCFPFVHPPSTEQSCWHPGCELIPS